MPPFADDAETQLEASALTAGSRAVKLRTKEEAAQWFSDRGITISEWALERRFNPALVYQVLAGTRKAVRGSSFQIAVALGMKSMPVDDLESV
jgi:gp16 family phage-associated protein